MSSLKEKVAEFIAKKVSDGECLGLGTGSTAECVIRAIGKRISEEGMSVSGVSTSIASTLVAQEVGISVLTGGSNVKIDWGFDGADEVTPSKELLKGRGGALLKEKIIAKQSPKTYITITEDKLVTRIGEKFPVPVEVIPEAIDYVRGVLSALKEVEEVEVRQGQSIYGPVFTESGNLICDVKISHFSNNLIDLIKSITGVVDHGVFHGFSTLEVVCAYQSGEVKVLS